jgi:hypothetical protein
MTFSSLEGFRVTVKGTLLAVSTRALRMLEEPTAAAHPLVQIAPTHDAESLQETRA